MGEIAAALQSDRDTVTRAIAWWHTSRDLPVPDGRVRRKSLARKVCHRHNSTTDGDSNG
jgi:hypothetical protein